MLDALRALLGTLKVVEVPEQKKGIRAYLPITTPTGCLKDYNFLPENSPLDKSDPEIKDAEDLVKQLVEFHAGRNDVYELALEMHNAGHIELILGMSIDSKNGSMV